MTVAEKVPAINSIKNKVLFHENFKDYNFKDDNN